MPLLRKGVLLPVKGIDFSQPSTFIDPRAGFPLNMRFFRNEIRKRPGKTFLNEVIEDETEILGLGKLLLGDGSSKLVRASQAKLEVLNTTANTWDSISATDFTGDNTNQFFFTTVTESELLIITNGFDKIRKWNGSGNNSVLGGNPPVSRYCTYLSPYLLIAYTTESGDILPWKIRWSDTDNPEEWSTGNSGSYLASDEPSPIQNIKKLNEFVALYKQDSLYLGRKVATSDIFIFEPIKSGIGLAAPKAVAEADGQHYFLGLDDIYVWNGIREQSIGKDVRDEIFTRINRTLINKCFAVHVQEVNEIWFFIIVADETYPTEIWKYNYRTGFWYQDSCDNLTAAIKWASSSSQTWDDQTLTWDQYQGIWDSGTILQDWEQIVFGNSSGRTMYLDYQTTDDLGSAVESNFVTKDFTGDYLEYNKRWMQLDVWAQGIGRLFIDYSTDFGDTWVSIQATSSTAYLDLDGVNRKYTVYFDVVGQQIRFRFRNSRSNETFYIRNFYPFYLVKEQLR